MQKQKPCIALDPHGRSPTYAHSGGTIVYIPIPSYYEVRHRTIGNPFSRPMSPLFSPNSREEYPLPSCAHSPHRITTHDGIYELSIRNKQPLVRNTQLHDSFPFPSPRKVYTEHTTALCILPTFAYCHNGPTSAHSYLQSNQFLYSPRKMALAIQVALSANCFTKECQ